MPSSELTAEQVNELAELRSMQRRVVERLNRRLEPPVRRSSERCNGMQLESDAAREVALELHDARREAKALLPLTLTTRLSTRHGESVRAEDEWGNPNSTLAVLDPSVVRSEVERMQRLQFKAVYHLQTYVHPRVIQRKDRPKPEWIGGYLGGRLVLYDLDTAKPLCERDVAVQNDIAGASTSRRRRSQTRDAFVEDLGSRFQVAAEAALAQMAPELRVVFAGSGTSAGG